MLAMHIGMPYDEYWIGEPERFIAYAKLYVMNEKKNFAHDDLMAWMIGCYTHEAFAVVEYNLNRKTGQAEKHYGEKPRFSEQLDKEKKAKNSEQLLNESYANFLAAVQSSGFTINEAVSE